MQASPLHRYSVAALHLFSFTALLPLLVVVGRGLLTGHLPPPEADEGTGAHVFQLSIAALLPTGMVVLTTADWTKPLQIAWRFAAPAVFVAAAFGLLYYYEHVGSAGL